MLLQVLVALIVIDYLIGMLCAAYHGEVDSKIGFKGIAKKVTILVIVSVAHLIDQVSGTDQLIRDVVIFFYISNEAISITESAVKIGIPVPNIIQETLSRFNQEKKGEE